MMYGSMHTTAHISCWGVYVATYTLMHPVTVCSAGRTPVDEALSRDYEVM